jgi:rubrerythrin
MDVERFIDSAINLETRLSQLYGMMADISEDPPIAKRLKKLSADELKHAAILRRGKSYYVEMPDLFSGLTVDAVEVENGLEEIRSYQASLKKEKDTLIDRLRRMLDFEERFERIHFGISVKIKDQDLKKLFLTLQKGDQNHVLVLKALIEMNRDYCQ